MMILRDTSLIAVVGFLIGFLLWSIVLIDEFLWHFPYGLVCIVIPKASAITALSGLLALAYVTKTGHRGKLLAVLAIVMGAMGFLLTCL